MPKVRTGEIELYYEICGQGEPLLLIMGLGGGSSLWWEQAAFFCEDYLVITYDSRGVGRSDKPDMPYSMDMLVEDAAGLLGQIGIRRAHVYGVSMGGMVAQALAVRYPEMVASLILGATTCGGAHAVTASQETLEQLFSIMRLPVEEVVRVSTTLTFSPAFTGRCPRPTSTMVPTITRTMLCRNRSAVMSNQTCFPSFFHRHSVTVQ